MSFNLESTLGFALHHSSYQFKTAIKLALQSANINVTNEEFILLFLTPTSGIEQSDLILKTRKDKTNVARLIARLVEKGYLSRQESTNRRQQTISLTVEGQQVRETILPILSELMTTIFEGITSDELEVTRLTLNKISKNLNL